MKVLPVLLSCLLIGCSGVPERPVKTGEETRIVTLNRTYAATAECSKDIIAPPGWYVAACAWYNDILCRITMRPDATDDTLGHEARHFGPKHFTTLGSLIGDIIAGISTWLIMARRRLRR